MPSAQVGRCWPPISRRRWLKRLVSCLVGHAAVAVEDGQALSFPEASFDAVICSLGLMFFPEPARGLAGFHRMLRPGGRAAVSVKVSAGGFL